MPPNYTKIYLDLLQYRKMTNVSEKVMTKIHNLKTVKDVLDLEAELFGNKSLKDNAINQQLKCYDEQTIKIMLKEQLKYGLTNTQLSKKYKLSRNTIAKWKTVYNI